MRLLALVALAALLRTDSPHLMTWQTFAPLRPVCWDRGGKLFATRCQMHGDRAVATWFERCDGARRYTEVTVESEPFAIYFEASRPITSRDELAWRRR